MNGILAFERCIEELERDAASHGFISSAGNQNLSTLPHQTRGDRAVRLPKGTITPDHPASNYSQGERRRAKTWS